jgi:autotransporter-associated beta strand protein
LTGGGGSGAAIGTISTAANTSGGMTFSGNGTTTLSAANTYTGGTTITAGTLALTGSGALASTSLSIATGATLDVSAKGSFSLNSGQALTLALDASTIGVINSGTVALGLANTALTLNISTGTPGASYDFLTSSLAATGNLGSVTLSGSFSGSLSQSGDVWSGISNGYSFSLDQTSGALSIAAVPEPREFALAIMGLLGVLIFIRRRKQAN